MYWDDPAPIHSLPVDSDEASSYNNDCKEEAAMLCNVCGNEIIEKADYIEIKKEWGYFSKKDTEVHEFKMCERCYDRLIKQFEVAPKITEKKEILS
jgi:ribosomal-protein-alanine N-acetyltransferase